MTSLKTNFAVKSKYEAFYIGGKVQLSNDGIYMFCCCGNKLNILEISTGKIYATLGEKEDEEITSFCLTPDNKYVILATQPLLLRQWDWRDQKIIRTWKAIHTAPVLTTGFDSTSTLLATGSADATIKVWDIDKKYCTHNLRGHQVFISCVSFHPDIERLELYSAGGDYKVRIWNLKTSTCIVEIGAHFSAVTSIVFSKDGKNAYTSGRDGVVVMWDSHEHKVSKTIPVFEKVESVVLLPDGEDFDELNVDGSHPHFITAGSKGLLRVWNTKTSRCVYSTSEIQCSKEGQETEDGTDTDDVQHISQMMYNSSLNVVVVVTYDHNISMFSLNNLKLNSQFAGNNDEIIDLKYFGENDEYAVVATNSKNVKVFKLDNWSCEILYGHTDTVLSLDVVKKGNRMITAGKDTSVRLWEITPEGLKCLAVGQGHTNPVAAVAFARLKSNFFVSGSEDCTLKVWPIPKDLDPSSVVDIHPSLTERAHEKEINSITVSPNDKFIATGSMDKTAKMWNAKDLSLVGVMRGHKRGIWCVQFSPVDQILATCSSDALIKLWSLTDFTCVRTFEGHESSIMKLAFITNGMQLLSGDSEGLVRLWTIKTNECEKVLEGHEGKIWALATNRAGDSFISGGVDSSVVLWEDVTEREELEKRDKQQQVILQEQELSNLIQKKNYLKAIGLAIVLEQPFRVLNIVKEILSEYENGEEKLQETLQKMRLDQIDALLRFSNKWNTNSRHCHEAQFILSSILKIYPDSELKKMGNMKSSVEGLLPYTERHFNRMDRLLQQSMFLEYTWQCMKGLATDILYSRQNGDPLLMLFKKYGLDEIHWINEIQGSNGRFVRVLHQGSNETTPENVIALPQREPFYTRDLTTDQAEVLRGLVNDNQNNKRSFGTQTEPVVIFQDRDELLASYDPKGRTLEDLAKLLADISSAVNDLKEPVSLIPGIKETIHSVQEDVTLSKILQEGLSNSFSTPAKLEKIGSTVKSTNEGENSPSVEQCVVTDSIEETISANVQNIIIEPGIKEEVIDPAESNCPVVVSEDAFVLGNIQVPITNQILTLENEFNASPDNNIHEKGNTSMDVYTAEILKPHPLLQSYSGPFAEISSHNDMSTIPHECEVRVSKHLQHQLRPQLSYPGGYGWQIVQRLFRPQELVGRNYYGNYGKMPLSPRRRHAVEHVLTEVYNNDVIFIKQAISGINTGIRNCMRTRVNRKPLFPIKTINNSLC